MNIAFGVARASNASEVEKSFMNKLYYVYMLTNFTKTTLYVGVTGNLERRIFEHKSEEVDGFTKRYHVTKLIYAEAYESINDALEREKQLKRWRREKKNALINSVNPEWKDLIEGA